MLLPFPSLMEAMGYVKAVEERFPCLIELINEGDYDVVGLQEVFYKKAEERIPSAWLDVGSVKLEWTPIGEEAKRIGSVNILDLSPNEIPVKLAASKYYLVGPSRGEGLEVGGGLMILSRYPITAASAFIYGESADWEALASKGALYARIDLAKEIGSGCYIHVFITHMQAGREYGGIRWKQLIELKRFIENATRDDEYPIVLMGDFNIVADMPKDWGEKAHVFPPLEGIDTEKPRKSEEYEEMEESFLAELGLKDAWIELHPGLPGFTIIGPDWGTCSPNPYGDLGNTVGVGAGWPIRIDCFFYHQGSGLSLIPESLELVPSGPDTLYCFEEQTGEPTCRRIPREGRCDLKSHTVSDHLGLEMVCKVWALL
jgi:hypothetical protein